MGLAEPKRSECVCLLTLALRMQGRNTVSSDCITVTQADVETARAALLAAAQGTRQPAPRARPVLPRRRERRAQAASVIAAMDDQFMCTPLISSDSLASVGSITQKMAKLARTLSPRPLRRTESPRVAAFRPSSCEHPPAPPRVSSPRVQGLQRSGSCAQRMPLASLLRTLFAGKPQ